MGDCFCCLIYCSLKGYQAIHDRLHESSSFNKLDVNLVSEVVKLISIIPFLIEIVIKNVLFLFLFLGNVGVGPILGL